MICFTLVFHSPVPLSVNETPVKQNIFSQSLQVLFNERLLLFGFKKVENPIMSEFSDSDSDSVKTCQNTSTRVDTQLPPSSSYLNCDSRAKDFESQRWSELLERARAAEVCMGCDFVNVTNESPKCYTDMASTAQLLYGEFLEVTAVTVLTTGTVSSWRLATSHLRAAWLSQTDDDHVLRAVYSFFYNRTHDLGSIRNLVRETDIFGNTSIVLDVTPPQRCPLCGPGGREGGLLPSQPVWDLRQHAPAKRQVETSHLPQTGAQTKPHRSRAPAPKAERKALASRVQGANASPNSDELSRRKRFNALETGASVTWAHSMRRNFLKFGFYAAFSRVTEGKRTSALEVADRMFSYDYPSWPQPCKKVWDYETRERKPSPDVWVEPRVLLDPGFASDRARRIATQRAVVAEKQEADGAHPSPPAEEEPVDRAAKLAAFKASYQRYLEAEAVDLESMSTDTSGAAYNDKAIRVYNSELKHSFYKESLPLTAIEVSDLIIGFLESRGSEEAVRMRPFDGSYILNKIMGYGSNFSNLFNFVSQR